MNKFEFPETAPKAEPLEGACNCSESAGFLENLLTASRKTLIWRGCIFIVLGILIMLRPVPAIAIIVMLSGIYAIIEGAYALLYSMRMPQRLRALPVLTSILIILLGTAAISFPWIMGEYAIIFWGIWLLLSGFQCFYLMRVPGKRLQLFISGLANLIAGVFFVIAPLFGLLTMGWIFALLFAITGVLMLLTAANAPTACCN